MSLLQSTKLSQSAIWAATLVAGAAFGLGYAAGRRAEHSASQQQVERLNAQLIQTNEANLRIWKESYSDRFRRPPETQGSMPPPDGLQSTDG